MNFYVLITQLQQLWIDIQSPPPPTESLQSSQNFGHSVGLPRDLWAPGKQRLRLVHVGAQLHLGLAHFKGHQGGWTESVRGGKATIVFWAPTLVREPPHASCPYEHRDIVLILRTRKWTHREVGYLTQSHTALSGRSRLGTYICLAPRHIVVLVNPCPEKTRSNFCFWKASSRPGGFPGSSAVKNLPVRQEMQETQVQSLSQEDPLEEGKATLSSILAWRISWTEEPGRLQSMRS